MDGIYKNIEECNPNKKRKILIAFDDMIVDILSNKNLKVVYSTYLLLCFLSLDQSTCETRKNIVYFTSKSSFHSRENWILDFQISWHHQMPKHKIRNTFYWITWEANIVC